MDEETAKLIVQTYEKINRLKGLLMNEPYPQIQEFIESGARLSELMNRAFEESTSIGLDTKLATISEHLGNLLSHSNSSLHVQENNEIIDLFEQLKTDVSILQSKINA